MSYAVDITERAQRFLSSLDKKIRLKVMEKIKKLAEDPYAPANNVIKLSDTKSNMYRMRVGDIRVFYEIKNDILVIKVIEIDFRTTTTYKKRRKK